jgi:CubicO group peptidase (beta-lactamase class C family)
MLNRREYLLGSLAAGIVTRCGDYFADKAKDRIQAALKQTVGARENVAGTVTVVIDEGSTNMLTYGSSGVPSLAMDSHTVFEIGSVTKVMTALMLAEMAAHRELMIDDPVAKYLPPSITVRERGRPITLLDLATYSSGLPKLPGNLPPSWWTNPNPFAHYTLDNISEFMSSYVPQYEPGTHFDYSSLGFGLLGIALARRAGMTYEQLLIEKVCKPLGLANTRITLSPDMQKHLAQAHDINGKPTPLWELPALQGAGAARANVADVTVFLKACIGLARTTLRGSLAQLLETRRPTNLAGTDAGLGWFISSNAKEEIAWKSGLTGGFNTFIGYSTKRRCGAIVLSNFVWQPLDVGTTAMGMKFINPDFEPGDLTLLYQ